MADRQATYAAEAVNETSTDALLSIQDLRVWFELRKWGFGHAGYVRAVDGVSFDLHAGEAIAIVGESGCGKSTLLKTILGLNVPTEGRILFNGKEMTKFNNKDLRWYRSQVGYVQQDPFGALPPFMTVEQMLEEPLIINGWTDKEKRLERITEVLHEVKLDISEVLPKFPHMFALSSPVR
jgi:peptide/nickel transport system ATP-binding protein